MLWHYGSVLRVSVSWETVIPHVEPSKQGRKKNIPRIKYEHTNKQILSPTCHPTGNEVHTIDYHPKIVFQSLETPSDLNHTIFLVQPIHLHTHPYT